MYDAYTLHIRFSITFFLSFSLVLCESPNLRAYTVRGFSDLITRLAYRRKINCRVVYTRRLLVFFFFCCFSTLLWMNIPCEEQLYLSTNWSVCVWSTSKWERESASECVFACAFHCICVAHTASIRVSSSYRVSVTIVQ